MEGSSLRDTGREIAADLDMTIAGTATGGTGISVGAKTTTATRVATVTGIAIASSAGLVVQSCGISSGARPSSRRPAVVGPGLAPASGRPKGRPYNPEPSQTSGRPSADGLHTNSAELAHCSELGAPFRGRSRSATQISTAAQAKLVTANNPVPTSTHSRRLARTLLAT